MLLRIGQQPDLSADLVGALRQCHERIRFFSELACTIAQRHDAPPEQIAEAARRVRRYFTEALPLHVADEEETLTPRLTGRDDELDRELERMRAEHADHAPLVAELLALLEPLERDPGSLARSPRAEALARSAARLRNELARHLADEEATIFPAIARLPEAEQERVRREIRRRRENHGGLGKIGET